MIRSDVLKSLVPVISDHFVVCNIGLPSQELHMLDDQPTNFYMLGTMGLSSSIGLGLALSQKQKVIAIDGDGSVLTNFGTLPTIANNVADNFILLIIDNGSYNWDYKPAQKRGIDAVLIIHDYGSHPNRKKVKRKIKKLGEIFKFIK